MKANEEVERKHLMFHHTPFSACGKYVPGHPGMIQVFRLSETTCTDCLKNKKEYMLVSANEKLKQLILFTDPVLSSEECGGRTQLIQWDEYLKFMEDLK